MTDAHKLLLKGVKEEEEKKDIISDPMFYLNNKKNLISLAKENLKSKNKQKIKNIFDINEETEKSPKKRVKSAKKNSKEKDNNKIGLIDSIFSDQEYLNFMLKDLKTICSSIHEKEKKNMPSFCEKLLSKIKNKHCSPVNKNRGKYFNNQKVNSNLKSKNCNDVNLLDQIVGTEEEKGPTYESKISGTENLFDPNEFYYENNINQFFTEETNN